MTPPVAEAERGRELAPHGGSEGAGLRAIVLYKTIKAGASVAGSLMLAAFLVTGNADTVRRAAVWLGHHVAQPWAVRAAGSLASLLTPQHVGLITLALALDGVLTSLEAWALRRGRPWGEWLVVVATGLPLPYEAFELVERAHAGRALLLVANLAVVGYLGRRVYGRWGGGPGLRASNLGANGTGACP